LKTFAAATLGYTVQTGSGAAETFIKILDPNNDGIAYRFDYSAGIATATLKRYTVNNNVYQAGPKTLYSNVAQPYPILIPSAVLNKDYDGNSIVNSADAKVILDCNKDELAFTAGCAGMGNVNWMFEKANDRIIYLSFRLVNQMNGPG